MIYILIIGMPVLFALLADKIKGLLSYIFAAAAISVPIIFAAVRDINIGTDVITYGIWTYRAAAALDLYSFMVTQSTLAAPGYNLIAWITGHFSSFEVYLGTLQAFTVVPFYFYVRRHYPRCVWPAMAAYMLLIFPISLNAMKQMIAVSLCLPAYDFVSEQKLFKFVTHVLLVSLLFHQSAVVFLALYPYTRLFLDSDNLKSALFGKAQRFVVVILIVALFVIAFLGGRNFITLFAELKDSYSYQLNTIGVRVNHSSIVMVIFFASAYIVGRYTGGKSSGKEEHVERDLLCIICVVGFFAMQLSMVADGLNRFAYYYMAFAPLYLSRLFSGGGTPWDCLLGNTCIICLTAYFYVTCVVNGGNQIYPYTSVILGII